MTETILVAFLLLLFLLVGLAVGYLIGRTGLTIQTGHAYPETKSAEPRFVPAPRSVPSLLRNRARGPVTPKTPRELAEAKEVSALMDIADES